MSCRRRRVCLLGLVEELGARRLRAATAWCRQDFRFYAARGARGDAVGEHTAARLHLGRLARDGVPGSCIAASRGNGYVYELSPTTVAARTARSFVAGLGRGAALPTMSTTTGVWGKLRGGPEGHVAGGGRPSVGGPLVGDFAVGVTAPTLGAEEHLGDRLARTVARCALRAVGG